MMTSREAHERVLKHRTETMIERLNEVAATLKDFAQRIEARATEIRTPCPIASRSQLANFAINEVTNVLLNLRLSSLASTAADLRAAETVLEMM